MLGGSVRVKVLMVLLGAVFAGLVGAAALQWSSAGTTETGLSSAIEWNAVQAVPRRAPDAEDVEWESRSAEQDSPSTGSGGAQMATRSPDLVQAAATVSPSRGIRASFSYCHTGGGINCVVDGDTFWIGGEKVRIAGIDAPETHPPHCDHRSAARQCSDRETAPAPEQRRGDDDQHRARPRSLRAAAAQRGCQRRGRRRGDDHGGRCAGICGRKKAVVLAPRGRFVAASLRSVSRALTCR